MVPRPVTANPACDATPDSSCTVPAPRGTNVGSVAAIADPRIVKRPEALLIGLRVSFKARFNRRVRASARSTSRE